MTTPGAFPIGLNFVLCCPTLHLRNTLIKAIEVSSGGVDGCLKPALKSDSESAKRAHYPPAISQVIINTPSQKMLDVLGPHSGVVAVIVSDRVLSAGLAWKVFHEAGYEATVHTQAEPEFPNGFLTFVTVPALNGIAIMFWPDRNSVPAELVAILPKRLAWTPEDAEGK